jgi:ankyrin repeat protein
MMQFLLNSGAKVNLHATEKELYNGGNTAIVDAAGYGGAEAVKLLLAHGADINLRNGVGHEPAILAAVRNDQTEVVRVLLSHGARLKIRSSYGETLMEIAAHNKNSAIITLLEEAEKAHSGSE